MELIYIVCLLGLAAATLVSFSKAAQSNEDDEPAEDKRKESWSLGRDISLFFKKNVSRSMREIETCEAYFDLYGFLKPAQECTLLTPYCCGTSCSYRYCCLFVTNRLNQSNCFTQQKCLPYYTTSNILIDEQDCVAEESYCCGDCNNRFCCSDPGLVIRQEFCNNFKPYSTTKKPPAATSSVGLWVGIAILVVMIAVIVVVARYVRNNCRIVNAEVRQVPASSPETNESLLERGREEEAPPPAPPSRVVVIFEDEKPPPYESLE